MNQRVFLDIYKSLTCETKTEIEKKLGEIESLQEDLDDLSEKINALSVQDRDRLEIEQKNIMDESSAKRLKIGKAHYSTHDDEETEELRNMDIIEHEIFIEEILTTQYPVGIDILSNKIDCLENEILHLVPKV